MPTQKGMFVQHYGGTLPNYTASATGTGDFSLVTPVNSKRWFVHRIHVINTGAAVKVLNIRDGGSGGAVITRVFVLNDVAGVDLEFRVPREVSGLYMDSLAGADAIVASVVATQVTEGL